MIIFIIPIIQACTIPSSTATSACTFCEYYKYLDGSNTCQSFTNSLYTSSVYISTKKATTCSLPCDGTKTSPYDNLIYAMKQELVKANTYFGAQITFNLEYVAATGHYITSDDVGPSFLQLFRRKPYRIIIQPWDQTAPADDSTTYVTGNSPIIYLKTDQFSIFVGLYLKIFNIIFDAIDLPLMLLTDKTESKAKGTSCPSNTGCNVKQYQFKQLETQYGLITIENLYDLEQNVRANTVNSIYTNLKSINNKYFEDGQVKLVLQQVQFKNFYLGIAENSATTALNGFQSLVTPLLGESTYLFYNIKITNSFAPNGFFAPQFKDAIYGDDLNYGQELLQKDRTVTIKNITIVDYNAEQIAATITTTLTNQINYNIINTAFYFIDQNFMVSIDTFSIQSISFKPTNTNGDVYGTILQIFKVSQAQFTLSSLTVQDLINIQFISSSSSSTITLSGGIINNCTINVLSTITSQNDNLFFIISKSSSVTLTSFQISNLKGNLVSQQQQTITFDSCQFNKIAIILQQQLFYFASTDQSHTIILKNSNLQYIISASASDQANLVTLVENLNSLTLQTTILTYMTNIVIINSPVQAYGLYFTDSQIINSIQLQLGQVLRASKLEWNNIQVVNITNTKVFYGQTESTGTSPQQNYYNVVFKDIKALRLMDVQSSQVKQNFQNLTLDNINVGSDSIFSLCCYYWPNFTNTVLKNSQFKKFMSISAGTVILTNFTYTQLINSAVTLFDVFFSIGVQIINSQINIQSGSVLFISGYDITQFTLSNVQINGLVSQIAKGQQVNNLVLNNVIINSTQPININNYMFDMSQVKDTQISYSKFLGLKLNLFQFLNSYTLSMYGNTFTNLVCPSDSCFKFQNQFDSITLSGNTFTNITNYKYFIDVEYSVNFLFASNKLINATLSSDLIYSMQTTSQIQSCTFDNLYSDSSFYVFEFIDSQSISLTNLNITNADKTKGKGSINANLINQLTLNNIRIDTMTITGDISVIKLFLFSSLTIKSIYFNNVQSDYSILTIETALKNLQLYVQDIECTNNNASFSSCLNLITESEFDIYNVQAQNNSGNQLYLKSESQVVIQLTLVSLTNIVNSNSLSPNRVLYVSGCTLMINAMNVYNIKDDSPAFYFLNSIVSISGSQFTKILPPPTGTTITTIYQQGGSLNLEDSQFISTQEIKGATLETIYSSNQFISLINTECSVNRILISGFNLMVFESDGSQILINNSYIQNNNQSKHFKLTDTDLNIIQTQIIVKSQHNFIEATSTTNLNYITLTNVTLDFYEQFIFGFIQAYKRLEINQFTITSTVNQYGTGLILQDLQQIVLNRSEFTYLNQTDGGCIKVLGEQQTTNIQIQQTLFKQCKAVYFGGALFFNKNVQGTLYQLNCQNNMAKVGGCIGYNGSESAQQLLIRGSNFIFNQAELYGGAVVSVNKNITYDQNKFSNNAAPSQLNKGSYGMQYRLVDLDLEYYKTLNDNDKCNYISKQITYTQQNQQITIASGQEFQLLLILVDSDEQIIYNDNNSQATIQAKQGQDTLVSNGVVQSVNGLFIFSKLTIVQEPGSEFTLELSLSISYGSSQVQSETTLSKNTDYELSFKSRLCQRGEILTPDQACLVCTIDTYSLIDPHDSRVTSESCNYCPQNAYCIEEAIYPKRGYWIYSGTSTLVLACRQVEYCLGEEDLYSQRLTTTSQFSLAVIKEDTANMYDQQCLYGHQNALCQECIGGYFKFTKTATCIPCQGNKAATMLVLVAVFMILMYYSIYQSERYMQKNQEGQDKAILIKIFVNYFQTLTLLGNVNLNWTKNITSVFDFGQDIFGTQFNFISLQCLQTDYISDQEQQFYMNLLLQMSIPFIIFIANTFYFIFHIIINWRYQKNRQQMKEHRSKSTLTKSIKKVNQQFKSASIYIIVLNAVVCVHLFYSLLTSTPTQLFYCETIAQDNFNNVVQYLTKNLNIQCWTDKFTIWFYAFGIMLSILFGLGIPILLAIYMYIYRLDLREFDKTQTTSYVLHSKKGKSEVHTFSRAQSLFIKKDEPIEIMSIKQSPQQGLSIKDWQAQSSLQANKVLFQQQQQLSDKSKSDIDTQKFSKHQTLKLAQMRKSKFKSAINKISIAKSMQKSTKKQKIKQSEVFLFLVDPYKSQVFYWEIVVLLRKFILIIIGLLIGLSDSESNKSLKYLLLNIYLIIFFKLNLAYDPYYSPLFNYLENYSFISIISSCVSGIISSVFSTLFAEILSDLVFLISNGLFIVLSLLTFVALNYVDDEKLGELMSSPQTKWKLLMRSILKRHKKRMEYNMDTVSSKFTKEQVLQEMINPMDC